MIRAALPLILLALAACSDPETGTDGSENDFASRVGAGTGQAAAPEASTAAPGVTTAIQGPPPAGASIFAMEKLGDISGVDLGPRAGGCAFSQSGRELLIASAPADRAMSGKAVVRIGGRLFQLDASPGGIAELRSGTSFAGEGFAIRVQPTAPNQASVIVTNGAGESRTIAGNWVCA